MAKQTTIETYQENIRIQRLVVITGLVLFAIKIAAWLMTSSVAILTDALESTVNVVASFIGLYSLTLSSKPKDKEHPYGHGKVEFISAAIEGTLISIAGLVIVHQAISNLTNPPVLGKLDFGILLVSISAVINYGVGWLAVKRGEKNHSLALVASGKHLQSDTYTTIGIIVGLALLYFTGLTWIDSVVALIFAGVIIYTGYKILRGSIAGIMDEADKQLLKEVVTYLDSKRQAQWIDVHNLRIIKYGHVLHVDFHMTVPWYITVADAHNLLNNIEQTIKEEFGKSVETFIHTDACKDFACPICQIGDCPVRKADFVKRMDWTVENISSEKRHRLN
jgi:cation diffusion facilitator family transporter